MKNVNITKIRQLLKRAIKMLPHIPHKPDRQDAYCLIQKACSLLRSTIITETEINDLVFEIEEIVCEPGHITEPAGRNCGFGISDECEAELTELLKNKLSS